MTTNVQAWRLLQADSPPGGACVREAAPLVIPLVAPLDWPQDRGGDSKSVEGAIEDLARCCGLRPAGLLAECASRPGRRVHAWLAVDRAEFASVSGVVGQGGAQAAAAAGVILLLESSPRGGSLPRLSIPWLLVRPDRRRLGVGRLLVAAAIDHAWGLGASQVSIDTLDRWPEAVAFWRGMGFSSN